jgi:hypothetical protein
VGELADRFSLLMLGVFTAVVVSAAVFHRLRQRQRRRRAAAAASPSS